MAPNAGQRLLLDQSDRRNYEALDAGSLIVKVRKLHQERGEPSRLSRRQLYGITVGSDCLDRDASAGVYVGADVGVDFPSVVQGHDLSLRLPFCMS
jgi:hypothetical protein